MIDLPDDWIGLVLRVGGQVVLLALGVLTIEALFRGRLAPRVRLGLWLVVVARLALPVQFEVRGPAVPWRSLETAAAPEVVSLEVASRPFPSLGTASARRPRTAEEAEATENEMGGAPAPASPIHRTRPPEIEPRAWSGGPIALAFLWALVAAVVLSRSVRAELSLRRRLHAAPPASPRIRSLVQQAARLANLRRVPGTLVCDLLGSPAVHGILRPRLLVPRSAEDLDDDALLAVLVHECFHLRRRDLLWVPGLALVRALWWFHPVAYLAVNRAAAALEETRDQDALRALEGAPNSPALEGGGSPLTPARLAYARVLVRLAEERSGLDHDLPAPTPGAIPMARGDRGLKRRIHVILNAPHPRGAARLAGTALIGTFLWASFVRAEGSDPELLGKDPTHPGARPVVTTPQGSIDVERQAQAPAWRSSLEAALERRIPVLEFDATPLPDAFGVLRQVLEVNLIVDEDAIYDQGEPEVTLRLEQVSGAEALDALCRYTSGLDWTLARESVLVDDMYDLPYESDLRFYKVGPLVERYYDEEWIDEGLDHLSSLLMIFSESGEEWWERENVGIQPWEGLLAIQQDEQRHREASRLLDRLLNRQRVPSPRTEPWRARIDEALARPLEIECESMDPGPFLSLLSETVGVSILCPGQQLDDHGLVFDYQLESITLRSLLELCIEETDLHITVQDGAIVLDEYADMEIHLHPVGGILAHGDPEEPSHILDGVYEFMYQTVDPASWDEDPRCGFMQIGDLLVVRQTAPNQRNIAGLLAQIERALTDG